VNQLVASMINKEIQKQIDLQESTTNAGGNTTDLSFASKSNHPSSNPF